MTNSIQKIVNNFIKKKLNPKNNSAPTAAEPPFRTSITVPNTNVRKEQTWTPGRQKIT